MLGSLLIHRAPLIRAAFLATTVAVASPGSIGLPTDEVTQKKLESLATEIAGDIERIRGRDFREPVSVELCDPARFEEIIHKSGIRELESEENGAKLLGLIPPGLDLAATEQDVVRHQSRGYYDTQARKLFVAKGLTVGKTKLILAHELSRALDDQLYDVYRWIEREEWSCDALLALRAVAEGSAMSTMYAWSTQALRRKKLDVEDLDEMPGLESSAVARAPEYLCGPLLCMYFRGPAFLSRTCNVAQGQMRKPDPEDVDRAFVDPPASTEQILHPEKYWDEDQRDEPVDIGFEVAQYGGWRVLRMDTLGELRLSLFLKPPGDRKGVDLKVGSMDPARMSYTCDGAVGWGGDAYLLFGRGKARVLLAVTRWDSEDDAAEFRQAAELVQPHVQQSNLELCLANSDDSTQRCLSGFKVERGDRGDEVLLVSWVGVTRPELERLLKGVVWRDGLPELSYRED